MSDKPIIMSAESVRAILDGRKTQTRRVAKPQGLRAKPRYSIGDHLWVKETYWYVPASYDFVCGVSFMDDDEHLVYRADIGSDDADRNFKWTSPLSMPRKLSRITLEVTEVRLQRLQDISVEDAEAEGVNEQCPNKCTLGWLNDAPGGRECPAPHCGDGPDEQFRRLWDSINGKKHPWVTNALVWAYTFKMVGAAC